MEKESDGTVYSLLSNAHYCVQYTILRLKMILRLEFIIELWKKDSSTLMKLLENKLVLEFM